MDHATCVEHQNAASGTCARCGAFLCPKCTWRTLCHPCFQRGIPEQLEGSRAQELARASWIAFVVVVVGDIFWPGSPEVMVLVNVMLWLIGLGVGVAALVLRRGATAVVVGATVGVGLNGLALGYFALAFVRARFGR